MRYLTHVAQEDGVHVLAMNPDGGNFLVLLRPGGVRFVVVASFGMGWDHVSVSLNNRCPTWGEMDQIKRLFFHPWETAMQLHVPPSDHISVHPYCLHIWRPQSADIPMPPSFMVA